MIIVKLYWLVVKWHVKIFIIIIPFKFLSLIILAYSLIYLLQIPIQRKNEETSAASLWLKVKKDECEPIFIWIFEEIIETMMTAEIDEKVVNQTLLSRKKNEIYIFINLNLFNMVRVQ